MAETKTLDVFHYQEDILRWLTALDARSGRESGLEKYVLENHLYRLDTYQSSYLGRITINLTDTVFEPCAKLFGRDFVCSLLAAFFKSHPPVSPTLTAAAAELPNHLRSHGETRESLLFADFAALCLERWELLIGPDPQFQRISLADSSLSWVYLIPQSRFIAPCGAHDLANAWIDAQNAVALQMPTRLFESTCGVLLTKTSATDLHVISVPESLIQFAGALVAGHSIEDSVGILESNMPTTSTDSHEQDVSAALSSFLESLSFLGVLHQKL